jgi:hypothetical protein
VIGLPALAIKQLQADNTSGCRRRPRRSQS